MQHVIASHGIDDACREGVLHDGSERRRGAGGDLIGSGARDRHAFAGADEVDDAEAEEEREGGHDFEIQNRFAADAAHVFDIAAAGDSCDQGREDERRDDGADEAQKDRAHEAQLRGE